MYNYKLIVANTSLSIFRVLKANYPTVPTLKHFTNYVEEQCKTLGFNYTILVKFMNRYPRLKAGGELLPYLIEFYVWIHTDLNHVITKEEATNTTITEAVEQAAGKYSKDIKQYYKKRSEKVQGK